MSVPAPDLVTGEAVVLDLRAARLASRSVAFGIDLAGQIVALLLGLLLIGRVGNDAALEAAGYLVLVVGVFVGYPVAFETLSRGRSLGKVALGLRVVRADGGPIRFRHALIRGLLAFMEIYVLLGVPAVVVSLASEQGRRVGDVLAGTVVVRERLPVRGGPMSAMPPPLAAWAGALELSGLPDELALAARQYLARWHELDPRVRAHMGGRLASSVAAHVSPPAPPGVAPEAYLSAVLTERRSRELRRLVPPPGHRGPPGGSSGSWHADAPATGHGPWPSSPPPPRNPWPPFSRPPGSAPAPADASGSPAEPADSCPDPLSRPVPISRPDHHSPSEPDGGSSPTGPFVPPA